jgi:hypothetical protein
MSARIRSGDSVVSPPARRTWNLLASFSRPSKKPSTHFCGVRAGSASERKTATGSPPIAAISLNPRVRQRCPINCGECHSRRKCTPSRLKSVVIRASWPAGMRSTAQSSPIPATTAPAMVRAGRLPARCRIFAMSSLSTSGTGTIIFGQLLPAPTSQFPDDAGQSQTADDRRHCESDSVKRNSIIQRCPPPQIPFCEAWLADFHGFQTS